MSVNGGGGKVALSHDNGDAAGLVDDDDDHVEVIKKHRWHTSNVFAVCMCCVSFGKALQLTYLTAVLTTIEKQYGLTSKDTGMFKSAYGIGYALTAVLGYLCSVCRNSPLLIWLCFFSPEHI